LLYESGTGCFVDAGDIQGIAKALRLLIEQPDAFRARNHQPVPDVIVRYERRALTEKLGRLFEDALGTER
jgi:hypothetical protein